MKENSAKRKLAEGKTIFGVNMSFPDAGLAEYLGLLGFDCLVADGEHTSLSDRFVEELSRAAELVGATAILRTPYSPDSFERYFALGIHGVSCPGVNSAVRAEEIVRAAKFAPQGYRGLGGRGINHGLGDLKASMAASNRETMVFVKIESKEGMAALPEILSVDGVDIVMIGHVDLSNSLGVPGEVKHPLVLETIDKAVRMITAKGKTAGLPISTTADVESAIQLGARYLSTAVTNCLRRGAGPLLDTVARLNAA